MSPRHAVLYPRVASFPRVSGDEPLEKFTRAEAMQFSLRERG